MMPSLDVKEVSFLEALLYVAASLSYKKTIHLRKAVVHGEGQMELTFILRLFHFASNLFSHFYTLYCSDSRLRMKPCPKVSSSFLNKALVGGFPCSHCGFRAVGCHFHLLFHHVGVTKPCETS